MEQIELQASKIKCGGCVSNIETGLGEIAGITGIKVNIETNIVSVTGDHLDKEAIETKLAELGYPVV